MSKALIPAALIAVAVFALAALSQEFTYIGAQKCLPCHKGEKIGTQAQIWEKSAHSKSFVALSSEPAAAAAQALGIKDPATSPQCLKCHSPLFEKAPDLKSEGVGCEVCHGPGSEYKKMSNMLNREAAVKAGLKVYGGPEAIKTWCLTCHANAHGKTFDFAAGWDKIKHLRPGK